MKFKTFYIIAIIALLMLLLSCSNKPSAIENTSWALKSIEGNNGQTGLVSGTDISAEFNRSEKTLMGSSGCNSYSVGYSLHGNQLEFTGPIAVTERACLEPAGVMEQEQTYINTLQNAESYSIEGRELKIVCGEETIIFTK